MKKISKQTKQNMTVMKTWTNHPPPIVGPVILWPKIRLIYENIWKAHIPTKSESLNAHNAAFYLQKMMIWKLMLGCITINFIVIYILKKTWNLKCIYAKWPSKIQHLVHYIQRTGMMLTAAPKFCAANKTRALFGSTIKTALILMLVQFVMGRHNTRM